MSAPANHLAEYDRLNTACGVFRELDALLLEFTGDDVLEWLQGQATNDFRGLGLGGTLDFCLVQPTGQVLAVCTAWSLPGRVLVSTQRACAASVLQRVEQMVIMEDVEVRDLDEALEAAAVQGPEATSQLERRLSLPSLDAGPIRYAGAEGFALRKDRTGRGGWDLWLPRESLASLLGDLPACSPEILEIARVEAGIPVFGKDVGPKTLPPELGPAFTARHVSYNKGCYTGQEVLMRMHSRGHANRRWMGLASERPLSEGARVSHPVRADAGIITSAVASPTLGNVGAAMLRSEVALPGESVFVEIDGQTLPAEVREMPFIEPVESR